MDFIIGVVFLFSLLVIVISRYAYVQFKDIREQKMTGFYDEIMKTEECVYLSPDAPKTLISSNVVNYRAKHNV